jgi:subtilisin-like proprotein convertase family protein/cytochrome c5
MNVHAGYKTRIQHGLVALLLSTMTLLVVLPSSSHAEVVPVGVPNDGHKFLSFLNTGPVTGVNPPAGGGSPLYREDDITAAAYYTAIDPDNTHTTLAAFKKATGLNAGNDALAVYINNADLGFGRRMYTRTNADGSVTSCVENYGGAPGQDLDTVSDQAKLNNAKYQTNLIATVCMEYSGTPGLVSRGNVIAENDNVSTTNLNSRVKLSLAAGTYNLVAATKGELAAGSFTLTAVNSLRKTLLSKSGSWTSSAGRNPFAANNPVFSLVLTKAATVTIDLKSTAVADTYLYVMSKPAAANVELMGPRFTKFYVYGADGSRAARANLDGRGDKFVPGVCNVCHGGVPGRVENGVYPKHGDTGAQFLPWDLETFVYDQTDPALSRAALEPQFKIFNKAVLSTYPAPVTKSYSGSVTIPDNSLSGVRIPLPVSGVKGPITHLTLSIDKTSAGGPGITHPDVGELTVNLISPNGRTLSMISGYPNGANIKNAYFLDDAEAAFGSVPTNSNITATPPFSGNWLPVTTGATVYPEFQFTMEQRFNGENPNGTWYLEVIDFKAGNTGTVNNFSLHFNGIPDVARIPAPVELIRGWYGGATLPYATFNKNFVPAGWLPPAAPVGASDLYLKVVGPTCRACHAQRGTMKRNELDFASYNKFIAYAPRIETLVYDQGTMPLARRTYQTHFWSLDGKATGQVGVSQADILANYLPNFAHRDAQGKLLTPGRPLANAGVSRIGSLQVPLYTPVTLNGNASLYANTYYWSLASWPAGSTASLLNNTTATPSFTPNVAGNYVFNLVVTNAAGVASAASSVTIAASSTASAPVSFNTNIWGGGSGSGLIRRNCASTCHTSNEVRGPFYPVFYGTVDERAVSYNRMVERINTDDPNDSLVLRKNLGDPHTPGAIFNGYGGVQLKDLMMRWILEGAKNN